MQVYFSDVFGVPRESVESYGAFDISVITDLPLFIDPFLLFNSPDPPYQELHDGIITYLRFLRDESQRGPVSRHPDIVLIDGRKDNKPSGSKA